MKKSAKEFWKERFGEEPQTDAEKLAVAMMADFALQVEVERKTFLVKALRKKGTEEWYWHDEKWFTMPYPENHDNGISIEEVKDYYEDTESPLPEDVELVELKFEIIEP